MAEQRADLRFLQERLRAHLRIAYLAADVQCEREHDEHTDQARVGDRERAEVQHQPAFEALLPQEQEGT
jgi:hypothetical protein